MNKNQLSIMKDLLTLFVDKDDEVLNQIQALETIKRSLRLTTKFN